MGVRFNKINQNIYTYIIKPVDVDEQAIDLVIDNSYLNLLIPGEYSGLNAKIIRYNKSNLSYIETIELLKSGYIIKNAKKIDIDNMGVMWVISEVDPIIFVKIYYDNGWDFTSYELS